MSAGDRRRLVSSLEDYVRHREAGSSSKRHVRPVINFARAELIQQGVPADHIRLEEVVVDHYFPRRVDIAIKCGAEIDLLLLVVTQSGSIRKNLNNRKREIVGDAVNLRLAQPKARIGLIYLIRADKEATRRGHAGTSPIDELVVFLSNLQLARVGERWPLLDAAALIAADREADGTVRIERVPAEVDPLGEFFRRIVMH